MNYIRHLTAFYVKAAIDERLNPTHLSLYHALFQLWNLNRFENPISVTRTQIVKLSKIGSHHTLYRCFSDLHNWGYIVYRPSHNPLKGSYVNMCNFDKNSETIFQLTCAKMEQDLPNSLCKFDTSYAPKMHPLINNKEYLNNKLLCGESNQSQIVSPENMEMPQQRMRFFYEDSKRKKVSVKKEKVFIPPVLKETIDFFISERYPEIEAKKFFYHFEANGWKVGGKTPMKSWEAAAHHWMLNAIEYEPKTRNKKLNQNNSKDYGEPL